MNILVISDTHRNLTNLESIIPDLDDIGMVLHLGDVEGDEKRIISMFDCPVEFVRGNCDYNDELPMSKVVEVEGHKIFMAHGHSYLVNFKLSFIKDNASTCGAEMALYGHLHIPNIEYDGDFITASPGSLSEPRQAGRRPSYMIIKACQNKKMTCELFYL